MMRRTKVFLLALIVGSFSLVASAQVIDNLLEDEQIWKVGQETGEGVSVIVHLQGDTEITFEKKASTEEVAGAAARRQGRFLGWLKASGLSAQGAWFARGEQGFRVTKRMTYQPAVVGNVSDWTTMQVIAEQKDVRYIERNKTYELQTVQGRALTGSDTVAANGWRGQGIGVAVLDTNFDLRHAELGGTDNLPNGVVFGGHNFSADNDVIQSQNWLDCYHGTATASIVRRYAPDVHLYTLVVFPLATDANVADAINWCITNRNGVNGGNPIRVISMSFGGGQHSGYCDTGLIHQAAGAARANGILLLASAGNDGWTSATRSPSCSSNVISVGAVWDQTGAPYTPFDPAYCNDSSRIVDERTCYSNRSWALNVYAPSEEVICASCGGGTAPFGGTSAACPAAAGMVAQLLSLDPSFIGDKDGVVDLFTLTGDPVSGAYYPRRRINIGAAIQSCSAVPAQPSYISGPNSDPCPYADVIFQTPAVPNADHYEWEIVGSTWRTVSESPIATIRILGLSAGSHTLRVRATNCAGASPWRSGNFIVLSSSDPRCRACGGKVCR